MDIGREKNEMEMDIVEASEAARIIGISIDTIRSAADEGKLKHFRTNTGRRLFQRKDVLKYKEARDKKKTLITG